MPCTDGGVPYAEDSAENARLKNRLDKATRLLCGICRSLEKAGLQKNINWVEGLPTWWENHKAEDARWEAKELIEREEQRHVKAALAKLSLTERKLLRKRNAL